LIPVFATTKFGKPVLIHAGYRYTVCGGNEGPKKIWRCVRHGRPPYCCVSITTVDDIKYITSRRGKAMIQAGQYRFYQHSSCKKGPKLLWVCVKWCAGCRASITSVDDEIIKSNNVHNHH
ncbi:hypothetical protein MSG28_008197, partial [Choristoneura fumiferana]